jgi:hypothetical protein
MQTLKRAGFGFLLGMAVGNLIAGLTGHPNIVSPVLLERAGSLSDALLWQTVLSGVIGGAAFAGVSVYEIERCPLLLADAMHYVCYMIVFLPIAFFLGWTEKVGDAAIMAVILLAVHTLIFLIMCARYRAEVKELNELNELRKARHSQQQSIGGTV